jgi:hypothetical protein
LHCSMSRNAQKNRAAMFRCRARSLTSGATWITAGDRHDQTRGAEVSSLCQLPQQFRTP